jgi:hypothetical protein
MDRENKKFRLYFESPFINFTAEADSIEALNEIALNLKLMGFDSKILSDTNLEIATRQAFVQLKTADCSGQKRCTSLSQKGVELDIIRSFLQGLTAREAIGLIKESKGVKISPSAAGRIYIKLRKVGVISGLFPKNKTVLKSDKKNSKLL